MERVFINIKMETFIKDTLKMIKKMDLEFSQLNLLNSKKSKAHGKTINSKDYANTLREVLFFKETSNKT